MKSSIPTFNTLSHQKLLDQLVGYFSACPQVSAIGVGGSRAAGVTDAASDIDLYLFLNAPLPVEVRRAFLEQRPASQADMGLTFWDEGDEWYDAATGIEVDLVLWPVEWIDDQVRAVRDRHQASTGYTTCFWHTIRNIHILHDPSGWLTGFQAYARQPYPEPLATAIIQKNLPLIRGVIPAYLHQIEKAVPRGDMVSVNHRLAALLASYFDILFAVNRVTHPGEKKLVEQARRMCVCLPDNFEGDVEAVLAATSPPAEGVVTALNRMADHLDEWLSNTMRIG